MSRLQADLALLFAGLIWGFGFVAQKDALTHLGSFSFVAARFLVSALFILPFVIRENGFRRLKQATANRKTAIQLVLLGACFSAAVLFQQFGIETTTIINAAFITSIYIVMVPFVGALFLRSKLSLTTILASIVSVLGIWLLSVGSLHNMHFSKGDVLVLLCAISFAGQVIILGHTVSLLRTPFTISFLQYMAVGIISLICAICFEHTEAHQLLDAWWSILFTGIASGGIAYTLQAVAQQHTPSADAAIIMSSEALFGGIGGIWLLHEKLTVQGILGCCAIIAAIMLVELGPLLNWGRQFRQKRQIKKQP